MEEKAKVKVKERMVLRKFKGDSEKPEDLLEVAVLEDGDLVERWFQGDPGPPPED